MIKPILLLISVTTILSTFGCNNQTNNRLSATNACDSSVRAEDPTAYGLTKTEIERKLYQSVDPTDFPDNEALAVISIVTTFEVALENEDKALIRVVNTNVQSRPNGLSVQCVRNISLDSTVEKTVTIPISNDNGEISLKQFKLVLGNPEREDKSDFIKLTEIEQEVSEAGSDDTPKATEPVPFSSYFSEADDEFQFFKLKEDEDADISEKDRLKESFFIHYKNDTERVRSRMTVSRIIKDDKKK